MSSEYTLFRMDKLTLDYYNRNAEKTAERYESVQPKSLQRQIFKEAEDSLEITKKKSLRILELGCGSGRESALLLEAGHTVLALDGSRGMIEHAEICHPELKGRCFTAELPFSDGILASSLFSRRFDMVLLLAVIMHLDDAALAETLDQVRRVLAPRGRVFISSSFGRTGIKNARDGGGRLFIERSREELTCRLEKAGLRLSRSDEEADSMGREGIIWNMITAEKINPLDDS